MVKLLSVPSINLGAIDAVSYKTREEKEFISKILYKEKYLDEILEPKKYFVIGEKGTGKTSYAVFLNNNDYDGNISRITALSATDYRRFLELKKVGKFDISSYVDIWKVILLLLVADGVREKFKPSAFRSTSFRSLSDAVSEYYHSAFRPEVEQSLNFVQNSELAAKILTKHLHAGASKNSGLEAEFPSFQINLAYLEKKFKDAIGSVNIDRNFILFIDSIDIRPDQIDYPSYIECIQGLANAAWDLNTEFFSNIKGSHGNIKIVLLMRPDILDNMGFQNLNAKVIDNGVVLDWKTTYSNFKTSAVFSLVSGIMAKQQDVGHLTNYGVWREYFPFDLEHLRVSEQLDDPFVGLLRYSFYRPRDIVQYLKLMQNYVRDHEKNRQSFSRESFYAVQGEFSDYLLGEVRDYIKFYHSTASFEELVGFFAMFGGRNSFTWDEFRAAHAKYKDTLRGKNITIHELEGTSEEFLQFIYSLNMVGYAEPDQKGGYFVHYCFRDRTTSKLRPKVKYGLGYRVHSGLQRALLVGGTGRTTR